MAGAPKGNNNAVKGKVARAALEKALERRGSPIDRYNAVVAIWDKLIEDAMDGDKQAAAMIIDRLDGKAAQSVEIGGEDGQPIRLERIERIITDPANRNA